MPKFDTHEDILDRSSPNDIVQHQNWELLEILRNQRWSRKRSMQMVFDINSKLLINVDDRRQKTSHILRYS
ncbi:hypothetical protein PS6_006210 [Mucor atramentarius]